MASDTKAVFISYRRDESAGYAGRIADSFVEHFGEDKVFRDIDSLEPGLDFAEAIEHAVDSSEVLIAVIGKNWLTATDAAGQKRLENPDDYVRTEIATALKRNIRVIPLLIQGAAMPSASELPDDLAPLSRRNAFEIHDSSWRDDIRRLVTALERVIKGNRLAPPDEPGAVKQPEAQPEEKQSIMQQVWLFLVGRFDPGIRWALGASLVVVLIILILILVLRFL
jgi:TIR domain